MTPALRIVVIKDLLPAEGEEGLKVADALREGLFEAGYDVIAVLTGDLQLPQRIASLAPDMIIIDAESAARDATRRAASDGHVH